MRVPSSTYRLQFNPSFRFPDAARVLGYLSDLGVSDIYASPILKPRGGSTHGYDVVDPGEINPELGTNEELRALLEAVKSLGMGWLQDVVSNHMAYDGANQMLMDVLEKGRESRYFNFFDIEWDHPYEGIEERVLAPFMGRIYGEALEAGEIRLVYENDTFSVGYFGFLFPLKISSYSTILTQDLKRLKRRLGRGHPDLIKLLGVIYVIKNLQGAAEFGEIDDQVAFVKSMLKDLHDGSAGIKTYIDENIAVFNGRAGDAESFILMDRLLSEQSFKLSFWKVAAEEINYRRFFNINELITLKAEDETVFSHTHALIFRLVDSGVTGLRIDHIDGLYDPLRYLNKIRERKDGIYLVVEKILASSEALPEWPVEGTTGYDFMNKVNGIFADSSKEARITRAYVNFTGMKTPYRELFYEKKRLITEMDMTSDVSNLAQLLKHTLKDDRYGSDMTLSGLKKAIAEVMSHFPVYRTYISSPSVSGNDCAHIREAVEKAARKTPALLNEIRFLEKILSLDFRDYLTAEDRKGWLRFVMRFQQFTGPLMAKGFEDTLHYVYNRLLSLNEVGGDPGRFGHPPEALHLFLKERAASFPHSMNATSTHDSKRGEDARARINVISELAEDWEARIKRWSNLLKRHKRNVGGIYIPDRNDEYFLYQTLVGSLPFEGIDGVFTERVKAYIVKAVREAKRHTAWLKPDAEYEEAFLSFIDGALDPTRGNAFLEDFLQFQRKAAFHGVFNSLSQTLIKLASPGVADFYQGAELWDLNLVDPDNRRPVDFGIRRERLERIKGREQDGLKNLAEELLASYHDGSIKLFVIYRSLAARRRHAALFDHGSYAPVEAKGQRARHIFSFAREKDGAVAIVIATRLSASLVKEGVMPVGEGVWMDTEVMMPEETSWRDALTGETISGRVLKAASVLSTLPVALLIKE